MSSELIPETSRDASAMDVYSIDTELWCSSYAIQIASWRGECTAM